MSEDKPVNRVHDQLTPTSLTRLLSIGRQLQRVCKVTYRLRHGCDAAKMLKTVKVNVVSVATDRSSDDEVFFQVVPADGPPSTARTSIASWEDFEE